MIINFFMKYWGVLFLLSFLFMPFAISQENKLYDTEIYRNRLAEFKTAPLLQNQQVVFLGNSLIQGGKWGDYFPSKNVANRGIIGDNTDGILSRLSEITDAKPEKLFYIGGINDISQDKTSEEILTNIKTIIQRVKSESPNTKIYVHSLLPINNSFNRYKKLLGKEKQIKELNNKLKKLCKKEKITFINLYPLFLSSQQVLDPVYTTDGLHLNEKGYSIWTAKIRKLVEE